MTLSELLIGAIMLTIAIGLSLVYFNYLHRLSAHRQQRMMQHVGVDPSQVQGSEAVLRTRCRHCPAEALCERWLAGEVEGDNLFCANAATFRRLKA
jgi:hypothetical protein